jgi:hypothetical protein
VLFRVLERIAAVIPAHHVHVYAVGELEMFAAEHRRAASCG